MCGLTKQQPHHYVLILLQVGGRCNDVACVLRGGHQLCGSTVPVIRFAGVRRRLHKRQDVTAELVLAAQLLRCPGRITADRLAHRLVVGDAFAKAAATQNLLLHRRELLQLKAEFAAQFPHRSLK